MSSLLEFEQGEEGVRIAGERHCRLVPPEEVTEDDLAAYRQRQSD
jgi:hypothetical protein